MVLLLFCVRVTKKIENCLFTQRKAIAKSLAFQCNRFKQTQRIGRESFFVFFCVDCFHFLLTIHHTQRRSDLINLLIDFLCYQLTPKIIIVNDVNVFSINSFSFYDMHIMTQRTNLSDRCRILR